MSCVRDVPAYKRAYRKANRDKIAARDKAYYEANREARLEYLRKWRAANREHTKAWREANRDRAHVYRKATKDRRRTYLQKWRAENQARERARYYTRRATLPLLVKHVISPPNRAALRPHAAELVARLARGYCEATGVELDMDLESMRAKGPRCPHLDRIDPDGGYVIGNVHWVCAVYNMGKQFWSHEDFMVVAHAAVRKDNLTKLAAEVARLESQGM